MKIKTILAVASNGGHWVQLMRMSPAFIGCRVYFVSTSPDIKIENPYYSVTDANRNSILAAIKLFIQCMKIVLKLNPDVIVTTGALPGLMAVICGFLLRKKTIWIDSIANSENISTSGKLAKYFSTEWVTQWDHLSKKTGANYWGSVL